MNKIVAVTFDVLDGNFEDLFKNVKGVNMMKKIMLAIVFVMVFVGSSFAAEISWNDLKGKFSEVKTEVAYAKLEGTVNGLGVYENIIIHFQKAFASPSTEIATGEVSVFFFPEIKKDGSKQNYNKFGVVTKISEGVFTLKQIQSLFTTETDAVFYPLNADGTHGTALEAGTLIESAKNYVYGVGGAQVPENINNVNPGKPGEPEDPEDPQDPSTGIPGHRDNYEQFGKVDYEADHLLKFDVRTDGLVVGDDFVYLNGTKVAKGAKFEIGSQYAVFVAVLAKNYAPNNDDDLYNLTVGTPMFSDYGADMAYKRYMLKLAFDWIVPENCYVLAGSDQRVATGTLIKANQDILIGVTKAAPKPGNDGNTESGSGGGGGCNSGVGFGALLALAPLCLRNKKR